MIHPSYTDLIEVVNEGTEPGEQPVVQSRYSIVLATAKRARQLIDKSEPLIDDTEGKTLVSASTLQKDVKAQLEKTNDVAAASYLGTVIGKKAVEAGITEVVFDRGGFIYQGKVKALADAAREAGLVF